jgi:hypothetical protein
MMAASLSVLRTETAHAAALVGYNNYLQWKPAPGSAVTDCCKWLGLAIARHDAHSWQIQAADPME